MKTSFSRWTLGGAAVIGCWVIASGCSTSTSAAGPSGEAGVGGSDSGAKGTGGKGTGGKSAGGKTGSGGATAGGGAGSGAGGATGTCTTAVAVACDGPEDCPTGKLCCGKWDQEYVQFGCFTSCQAQLADAGGARWFDLCHPGGQACEDPTQQCLNSTYLPTSLARCYTSGDPPPATLGTAAGKVNCGANVCGTGEKCCLRGTLDPYCTPSGTACSCTATGTTTTPADAATGG